MIYPIVMVIAWVVFHLTFRIKVVGRENLITNKGFVLAPNHVAALDPVFVVLGRFWGKRMVILAKEEIFSNWLFCCFFKGVNVIPVHRGKGDGDVIEKFVEDVRAGQGALLFPEGTRSKDGNLGRLKSGAFVIAAEAGVDIIPCRVIYKGGKCKLFGRCTVVYGKPIPAQELTLGEPRSAARLRECKAILEARLEQLFEENKQYL